MVFCFLGVAGAYALLNAELVAIIQILVYVGAISVVVLFAIMLTESQGTEYKLFFNRQTVLAAPLAVATAVVLTVLLVSSEIADVGEKSQNLGLRQLSEMLFNRLRVPFELVSLVLLAAMIGPSCWPAPRGRSSEPARSGGFCSPCCSLHRRLRRARPAQHHPRRDESRAHAQRGEHRPRRHGAVPRRQPGRGRALLALRHHARRAEVTVGLAIVIANYATSDRPGRPVRRDEGLTEDAWRARIT